MCAFKNTPFLYLNFEDYEGNVNPLTFTHPIKTIIAWELEDVLKSIEMIQQQVKKGYYAAGYIAYEAAPAFDQQLPVSEGNNLPLLWFGIFKEPSSTSVKNVQSYQFKQWQPSISLKEYNKNVKHILKYIQQGVTKQVNYTIQMKSKFTGDPFAFYKQLEKAQSANYSAYINIGHYSILSASPELFFKLKDRNITTRPMKGTASRGLTYAEDIKSAEWLKHSEKNKRENKMIVNLMKNDLEKIACKGTIEVPKLYEIEKYPTVYQMTSTVTAQISKQKNLTDIFKALFPCGSITGSPRKATMEIIKQLEGVPREVYCGTIGYITPENEAVFNVPIRTVTINNKSGQAIYGVGGAITEDSTKEEEYGEVLTKTKLLTKQQQDFELLETMRLSDGNYFLLDDHLNRVHQSAQFFNYNIDIESIKFALVNHAKKHVQGDFIVRLLVNQNGEFTIEAKKLLPNQNKNIVTLANEPINKDHLFLHHKTTNRHIYEVHQVHKSKKMFDVLLWNEQKELTEFTIGNLVVKLNGKLVTPPISSGLLAGTFRSSLINDGIISEQKLYLSDLRNCEEIWLINSVRKWVRVALQIE